VSSESDTFVSIVRGLVRELCPSIVEAFRAGTRSPVRKLDGSLVTETDYLVEQRLSQALAAAFPEVTLLGEEMAASACAAVKGDARTYYASVMTSKHHIIIDPIDGTRNFVEGKNAFCLAVAFTEKTGDGVWPRAGVVAVPVEGVMYWCDSTGVFREDIGSAELVPVKRQLLPDVRMSASSRDREWLSSHGYTMKHRWLSSGSSVHDFVGTAIGRVRGSVVGHQRLWDLMAPLAIGERLGCVLRDIETGEQVSTITPEELSLDLQQRPWGLTRKMLLMPADAQIADFVCGGELVD
jgi:fructose-1,6-bisphosphatase/inositol monophosphatase family enzyme